MLYEVFAGNTADATTVEHIVETMEARYGKSDRIWVMDRGMVSEENIEFLKEEYRRYIIGATKSHLKKFEQQLLSAGCYPLRSNVTEWSDEDLWKADIQLTEAEAAFRIHKSDLSIRPIWHQKADRVLAHILVCFLAYVLWKTLGPLCIKASLGGEPRCVLKELSDIRLMDVVLPTKTGIDIRTRCIRKPADHQQILLDHLGLRLPSKTKSTEM